MPFDPTGFREAADESKSGDAPPDAIYEAELVGSKIATRQSDDAQWVVFTWKVVSGAHRDSSWESMHTLDRYKPDGDRNPGLVFTVQALRTMGMDVDGTTYRNDTELEHALRELEHKGYSVEVKRSGSFTNTYVKDTLSTYSPSLPGSATPSYGQAPNGTVQPANAIMGRDDGGTSAPPQSLGQAGEPIRKDVERTGASDIPSDVPWAPDYTPPLPEVDRENAPKKGDIDPATGEAIPF
jgi:hypothetical protein